MRQVVKAILNKLETSIIDFIAIDRYLPIQLDITNACNLRCVHCYHPHHKNEGAISLEEWFQILNQYKELIKKMKYKPWIMLCGGEPLLSSHLLPLLSFIKNQFPNAKISILTNGTLISDELLLEFKKYPTLGFQISLDGPDAERHDQIRGNGNFKKTIINTRKLLAIGCEVSILAVLSKRTSFWMEDFFRLSKIENFKAINFIRFVPEGYGKKLVNQSIDQPLIGLELKEAYQKLIHFMAYYNVQSRTQSPLFELIMPGLGRNGRYWEGIAIDYQGYMLASSRAKMRLGHVLHEGLENLFLNNPIYKSLRKGNVDICGKCKLYAVCGGDRNAAYAATGNYLGFDPGCWKTISNKTRNAI